MSLVHRLSSKPRFTFALFPLRTIDFNHAFNTAILGALHTLSKEGQTTNLAQREGQNRGRERKQTTQNTVPPFAAAFLAFSFLSPERTDCCYGA